MPRDRLQFNKYMRDWRAAHKERAREISRVANAKQRRENPKIVSYYNQSYYTKIRTKVINFFGGKCQKCGISDFRVLQIDHREGDGYKDRGRMGYRKIRELISLIESNPEEVKKKYQLLCANCNWIKRWENKEYRHKKYEE
jgi:hypothetical protein